MKLGLIGGVGPESTIKYYRLIISEYQNQLNTKHYPEFLIQSINMTEMLDYVFNKKFEKLIGFLSERIRLLEMAGADFIAIASNTPHIVFDELADKVRTPMVSIVEETCKNIAEKNISRVALFGTKSTMTAGFYQETAKRFGIEVILPDDENLEFIHDKYMNELVFNEINPKTKNRLVQITNQLKEKSFIEGLILGGTELSLILEQSDFQSLQVLDTTLIHVNSLVKKMVE